MNTSPAPSTGRLSVSQPEVQHFPGTPEALALARKLRQGRDAPTGQFLALDFSKLESRVLSVLFPAGHPNH